MGTANNRSYGNWLKCKRKPQIFPLTICFIFSLPLSLCFPRVQYTIYIYILLSYSRDRTCESCNQRHAIICRHYYSRFSFLVFPTSFVIVLMLSLVSIYICACDTSYYVKKGELYVYHTSFGDISIKTENKHFHIHIYFSFLFFSSLDIFLNKKIIITSY